MVSRYSQPITGQESLFDDPQAIEVIPEQGIAVDLQTRATHLVHTLDLLAAASKRTGFLEAMHTPHVREFEVRYGDNLPTVQEGVKRRESQAERDAEWQYAYATGHIALKAAVNTPEEKAELGKQTRAEYAEFLARFGGSQGRVARDKYRRQLNKTLKNPISQSRAV